jgi:hypothetical protein
VTKWRSDEAEERRKGLRGVRGAAKDNTEKLGEKEEGGGVQGGTEKRCFRAIDNSEEKAVVGTMTGETNAHE